METPLDGEQCVTHNTYNKSYLFKGNVCGHWREVRRGGVALIRKYPDEETLVYCPVGARFCVCVCVCAGCGRCGPSLVIGYIPEVGVGGGGGGRRSPEMTLQIQPSAFHLPLTETWPDAGGPAFLPEPHGVSTRSSVLGKNNRKNPGASDSVLPSFK